MNARFKPYGTPLLIVAGSCFCFLLATAEIGNRSEALEKLRTWPKAQATVWRMDTFGGDHPTYRANVSFLSADGKKHNAYVFDGPDHPNGDEFEIFYDPGHLYPIDGSNRHSAVTAASLTSFEGPNKIWQIAGWLGGGVLLFSLGGYRAYCVSRGKIGAATIASLFEPRVTRPARPIQLLAPSATDRAAIERIVSHDGTPRQSPRQFRIAPPPEIGSVVSAESSIPASGPPSLVRQLLVGILGAGLFIAGAIALTLLDDSKPRDFTALYVGCGGGVVIFIVHCLVIRYKADCTYVGRDGLARCTVKGRKLETSAEMMQFADATELRAETEDVYLNGIYTGTTFDYFWTEPEGKIVWRIKGTYKRKKIKEGDTWRFAQAAELSWSNFYFARVQAQLAAEGALDFRIDDRRSIRIGPGYLEFAFSSEPTRVQAADLEWLVLNKGTFFFKNPDEKWNTLIGKYTFDYSQLANAKVFLIALEKLTGRKI